MSYKFDFVKHRKIYFIITLAIVAASVLSLALQGLNLGIDFVSGSRLDIQFQQPVDLAKSRQILEGIGFTNPNTRVGGPEKNILIFRVDGKVTSAQKEQIRQKFEAAFNQRVNIQEQTVDPIIGRELARNAIISVLIASVGIIIYVGLRFEFRYAVSAVLTLFYDAIFTMGMFSILRLEVDINFIAAILTIVGYSVNDTIVIFDRIRENMERYKPTKWEELADVVNLSINQTLTRSINTVLTVVFGALSLTLLGGESIRNFSLALLFGLISGAYSSIFVASPLWIGWKWSAMKKEKKAGGGRLATE